MKSIVQFFMIACLALVTVAVPALPAIAADKPTVVVSFSGVDQLLGDIGYLCEVAGQPQAAKQAAFLISAFVQGVDRTKPAGALITVKSAEDFTVLAFVPVSDLKTVFKTIEAQLGEPKDAGKGAFELDLPGTGPVFIKEQTGYAFIARSLNDLNALPADPLALLGGMNKDYDLGIRLLVQNLPEALRKQLVDQVRMGLSMSLEKEEDEDESVFELRKKVTENQIKQIETLVTETDTMTVGLNIDSKAKRTFLDTGVTFLANTKSAKRVAALYESKTDYSGFLRPDAAANLNFATLDPNPDVEQLKATVDTLRTMLNKQIDKNEDLDDAKKKQSKELIATIVDVAEKTLATGKMDGGACLMLKPKSLAIVGGGFVADGLALEGVLKKLAEMEKDNSEFPKFKFDADKVGDVRMHSATLDVPDEEARVALGTKTDIVVGVSEKKFFFGIGKDVLPTLKDVLEKSAAAPAEPVLPVQFTVALAPIFEFAKSVKDDPELAEIAKAIAADGKDKFMVQVRPLTNGAMYRIEVEGGIIKAIGTGINNR